MINKLAFRTWTCLSVSKLMHSLSQIRAYCARKMSEKNCICKSQLVGPIWARQPGNCHFGGHSFRMHKNYSEKKERIGGMRKWNLTTHYFGRLNPKIEIYVKFKKKKKLFQSYVNVYEMYSTVASGRTNEQKWQILSDARFFSEKCLNLFHWSGGRR